MGIFKSIGKAVGGLLGGSSGGSEGGGSAPALSNPSSSHKPKSTDSKRKKRRGAARTY